MLRKQNNIEKLSTNKVNVIDMKSYSKEFLFAISKRGVVPKKHSMAPVGGAIDGGLYMGCPGKEIFYSLESLSHDDSVSLAACIASMFQSEPSKVVHLYCFLRYIYGCFSKQGCCLSNVELERMRSENRDWSKSDIFVGAMIEYFKSTGNIFGQILCYEMQAHRIGDLAVIRNDLSLVADMLYLYNRSAILADQIGCAKNACSANYWAFRYLRLLNKSSGEWMPYVIKFCDNVEKYDKRGTIKTKIGSVIEVAHKELDTKTWNDFVSNHLSKYHNRTLSSFYHRYVV